MFMCSLAAFLALKGKDNDLAEILVLLFGVFGALEVVLELAIIGTLMGVR